jgi:hypothetical protein
MNRIPSTGSDRSFIYFIARHQRFIFDIAQDGGLRCIAPIRVCTSFFGRFMGTFLLLYPTDRLTHVNLFRGRRGGAVRVQMSSHA